MVGGWVVGKQVRGTTRCVKSDKEGQNCKICLNLLFSFISSRHSTKPKTFGTICHHLVPFVIIYAIPNDLIEYAITNNIIKYAITNDLIK